MAALPRRPSSGPSSSTDPRIVGIWCSMSLIRRSRTSSSAGASGGSGESLNVAGLRFIKVDGTTNGDLKRRLERDRGFLAREHHLRHVGHLAALDDRGTESGLDDDR